MVFTMKSRMPFSLNESPSEKEGKSAFVTALASSEPFRLNESPSAKEGKFVTRPSKICAKEASMKALPKRKGNAAAALCQEALRMASMKALPKRQGNSYPKLARNHAAETGALREPRGGYTQNYTLHPHLPTHSHLTREETMRATRHVPVKHQALAQIQDPRQVLPKRPGGGLHV